MLNRIVGILVILGLGGFLVYRYFLSQKKIEPIVTPVESQASIEEELENVLGVNIPDDERKLELKNGDSIAIVRKIPDGNSTKLYVIADLPEGKYTFWNNQTKLGDLAEGKGGYILQTGDTNESTLGKLQIKRGEEVVLEGQF